jgi:NADH-quinone oxidoreductase subunit N
MLNLIAPIIVLPVAVAIILVIGMFRKDKGNLAYDIAFGALLYSLILFFMLPSGKSGVLQGVFRMDAFTTFFTFIFLSLSLVIAIVSSKEVTSNHSAYYSSLLLSTTGLILAAGSADLILIFLSMELVAMPSYMLVAFGKTKERMEAATKYFVISAISSSLSILGLAIIYGLSGTTKIASITLSDAPYAAIGVASLIAGIGFKMGLFPFNLWMPDVYQGSPYQVTALLAGLSKKAAFAVFLRLLLVIFDVTMNWALIFALIAVVTMTVANVTALLQTNVRRLIFYSIISHAGFIMLGLVTANQLGLTASLFHIFTHAFMVVGALLVLGLFMKSEIEHFNNFEGIGWRNKFLSASLAVFLLSLAGVPLLAGFSSKFLLFAAALDSGYGWLVAFAIANSVIALYYYLRIIRQMYSEKESKVIVPLSLEHKIAIIACLVVVIFAGVYPGPIISFIQQAAASLF